VLPNGIIFKTVNKSRFSLGGCTHLKPRPSTPTQSTHS